MAFFPNVPGSYFKMIYEYAVEPELVSTWTDRRDCRFCWDSFGMDKGRLISRCPSDEWKDRVWKAFLDRAGERDLSEKEKAAWQMRQNRLTTLLMLINETMMIKRPCQWESTMSWIDNVSRENKRIPFHAILTEKSLDKPENTVSFQEVIEQHHSLWDIETSKRIPRKNLDMAKAVRQILCRGQKIHFIDPHFGPENDRYLKSFRSFFQEVIRYRSRPFDIHIEVHLSDKSKYDFFVDECKKKIPGIVPEGLSVTFRRWRKRTGGEKLHDRFILTEIGGVKFSVGLDEGKKGETTDVSLMQISEYKQIWSQYAGPEPAFDPEDAPIVISGTMPCDDTKQSLEYDKKTR
jgi:hypothetical protein